MNDDLQKLTEAYEEINKHLKEDIDLKVSHIMDIIRDIEKSGVGKISNTVSMADGLAATLAFKDGQTYEIQIRPKRI